MAGLALATGLVLSWQVPADGQVLGADARLLAHPAGELDVRPAAVFVSGRDLTPASRGASGSVRVTNIAGKPLELGVRLTPSSPVLDRALRIRLAADGQPLASGRLGQLRHWSRGGPLLAPGQTTVVRAWIGVMGGPASAQAGGQAVEVTTEVRGHVPGTAR